MTINFSRVNTIIVATFILMAFGPTGATADDAERKFSAKSGRISIPDDQRNFLKELSLLAKKYPGVAERGGLFEKMCEVRPACFYVASWTACCCDEGGSTTCEAWPIQ